MKSSVTHPKKVNPELNVPSLAQREDGTIAMITGRNRGLYYGTILHGDGNLKAGDTATAISDQFWTEFTGKLTLSN